jgi:hypothetical protein
METSVLALVGSNTYSTAFSLERKWANKRPHQRPSPAMGVVAGAQQLVAATGGIPKNVKNISTEA